MENLKMIEKIMSETALDNIEEEILARAIALLLLERLGKKPSVEQIEDISRRIFEVLMICCADRVEMITQAELDAIREKENLDPTTH